MQILTWVWTVLALVGLLVYLRLKQRSLARMRDPEIKVYPKDHAIRRLSRQHVRTNGLWVATFLFSVGVGILIIMRDLFELQYEVPTGFGVIVILVLIANPVVIGLWNEWDEEKMAENKQEGVSIFHAEIQGTTDTGAVRVIHDATVTGVMTEERHE